MRESPRARRRPRDARSGGLRLRHHTFRSGTEGAFAVATPPEPVLPLVRDEVKRLLVGTPAFRALPETQRREIANNVVRIADFIVAGAQGDSTPGAALVAREQAESRR